jgi:membrane protease subunit (stomatin/prohibitin family)
MGIIHHEVSREFIAMPDTAKGQILFKWPDQNIRKFTRCIVDADQRAVFLSQGEVKGIIEPGQVTLDANEIPFLGILIDHASNGNAYRAEIFFVGTREYTGNRFGGRIDDVQDARTGMVVTLRVFGDYAVLVKDPVALILNLAGTINVDDNTAITDWVNTQLLKVMRTEITRQIVRNGWPILGLSAYTPDIEEAVLVAANTALDHYGLSMPRMGNFDVNLMEEDEAKLKELARDTSYTQLAGGFNQMAAGRALLGAGEGMAQGGGGSNPAMMIAGLGVGQSMFQQPAAAPPPAAPPAAAPAAAGGTVACPHCNAQIAAGSKFCAECGQAMPTAAFCTECGAQMAAGAKFCAGCGTPTGAGAAPAAAAPAAPPSDVIPPPPPAEPPA